MTVEPEAAYVPAEHRQRHPSRSVRLQRGLDRRLGARLAGLRGFLLAFLTMFLLSSLWTFATPFAGAPDEPAHIIKAAGVVRGQIYGIPGDEVPAGELNGPPEDPNQGRRYFHVPAQLAYVSDYHCNAWEVNRPQNCPVHPVGVNESAWGLSSASVYNPAYYYLVGWPSLLDTSINSVYLMRLINGVLVSLFAALTLALLTRLRRPTLPVLAAGLAFSPSIAFLGGTLNPNALEVTAAGAFTASLLVAISREARGRELSFLMSIAFVSGVMLAEARTLGFVWLGAAVLLILLWCGWKRFFDTLRQPATLAAVAGVAIAISFAIWQLTSTGSLTSGVPLSGEDADFQAGFRMTVERFSDLIPSMVGLFGWREVSSPSYVFYLFVSLTVGLVLAVMFSRSSRRDKLLTITALATLVLLPAIIQGVSMSSSGFIWQGRYSSALLTIALLLIGVTASPLWDGISTRIRAQIAGFAAISICIMHLTSLVTALRRHSVGIDGPWAWMLSHPTWSPPVLNNPTYVVLFALGSALFALLVLALARPLARRADEQEAPARPNVQRRSRSKSAR